MQLIHVFEQHLCQIFIVHYFDKDLYLFLLWILFDLVVDVFFKVLFAAKVVLHEEDHALKNRAV